MRRLLAPLLALLAIAQLHADIDIGSPLDGPQRIGDPHIRLVLGSREELTFANKVRIIVVNGKVAEIRNKAALQNKSTAAPTAVATIPEAAARPLNAAVTPPAAPKPATSSSTKVCRARRSLMDAPSSQLGNFSERLKTSEVWVAY